MLYNRAIQLILSPLEQREIVLDEVFNSPRINDKFVLCDGSEIEVIVTDRDFILKYGNLISYWKK